MILLSLGTHQQSFPRAIDLVEPLARRGEPLVIQHGSTPPRPAMPNTTWTEYMAFDVLVETMRDARSVVCHAGVGTIVTAIRAGHTPVVIPRQPGLGEHVDNHQMDIADRYAARGLVRCMTSGNNLASLLEPRSEDQSQMAGTGSEELRSAVLEAVASRPRRRLQNTRMR